MRKPDANAQHVLVLSADPMAAAFLGMFVELARYSPAFPHAGERPEDAVARVRPLAVVLLDGALDAAQSDLFFATAARARCGLAIFSAPNAAHARPAVAPQAVARGVPVFAFPSTVADVERMLTQARATQWWSRAAERRQPPTTPHVEPAGDDALVYHDRNGRRWNVYDRRGGDRRRPTAGAPLERVFVSESGDVWTCHLAAGEAGSRQPDDLEAQLARAVPEHA
jgi:hypothetical protein